MAEASRRSIGGRGPVQRLFGGEGTVTGLDDGQLIEQFVVRRDEIAFEAIINRHGPMVLGVCRRLLRNSHDVEDAFQATFLVLATRAGSLRDSGKLSPWLYGVARKVANRARLRANQQRDREHQGSPELALVSGVDQRIEDQELAAVLDSELARLPEKYRTPLVLCYLQGLSQDEAAQRLGWPLGTVRSRIARGRDRLRGRLTRLGVSVPVGLLAGSELGGDAAIAATPPQVLILQTIRFVLAISESSGKATAITAIPSSITILSQGVLYAMWINKLAWCVGMGVLAVGFSAAGARGYAWSHPGQDPGVPKATTVDDADGLVHERKQLRDQMDTLGKKLEAIDAKIAGRAATGSTGSKTPVHGQNKTSINEFVKAAPQEKKVLDDTDKDMKSLEGTWRFVSLQFDGSIPLDALRLVAERCVFQGDKVTFGDDAHGEHKLFFMIDSRKLPKTIDLTPLSGPYKGKLFKGIYELDGDRLKICIPDWKRARENPPRPEEFDGGEGMRLFVLERINASEPKRSSTNLGGTGKGIQDSGAENKTPANEIAKAAPQEKKTPDDADMDMKRFEGTWKFVNHRSNGKNMPPGLVMNTWRCMFQGNIMTNWGGSTDVEIREIFKIDSSKSPKTIDLTALDGKDNGKLFKGIYELKGDLLKICIPARDRVWENRPRPEEFDGGEGMSLFVLERITVAEPKRSSTNRGSMGSGIRYSQQGNTILIQGQNGKKLTVFNADTRAAQTYDAPEGCFLNAHMTSPTDASVSIEGEKITELTTYHDGRWQTCRLLKPFKGSAEPVEMGELTAIYMKGESIPQIAVFVPSLGWRMKELASPAAGMVTVQSRSNTLFFSSGNSIHTFSVEEKEAHWTEKLFDDDVPVVGQMAPNSDLVLVAVGDHLWVFNLMKNEWVEATDQKDKKK